MIALQKRNEIMVKGVETKTETKDLGTTKGDMMVKAVTGVYMVGKVVVKVVKTVKVMKVVMKVEIMVKVVKVVKVVVVVVAVKEVEVREEVKATVKTVEEDLVAAVKGVEAKEEVDWED